MPTRILPCGLLLFLVFFILPTPHTPLAHASLLEIPFPIPEKTLVVSLGRDVLHKGGSRETWMVTHDFSLQGTSTFWNLDESGRYQAICPLEGKMGSFNTGTFRLFDLNGDGEMEIVRCAVGHGRSNCVTAHDLSGHLLWSYQVPSAKGESSGAAVNDVAVADVNGDAKLELLVGFNGGYGIHLLDSEGRIIWEDMELGNCWGVAIGDANRDGQMECYSGDATGLIFSYTPSGKLQRILFAKFGGILPLLWPISSEFTTALASLAGHSSYVTKVKVLPPIEGLPESARLIGEGDFSLKDDTNPHTSLFLANEYGKVIETIEIPRKGRVGFQGLISLSGAMEHLAIVSVEDPSDPKLEKEMKEAIKKHDFNLILDLSLQALGGHHMLFYSLNKREWLAPPLDGLAGFLTADLDDDGIEEIIALGGKKQVAVYRYVP